MFLTVPRHTFAAPVPTCKRRGTRFKISVYLQKSNQIRCHLFFALRSIPTFFESRCSFVYLLCPRRHSLPIKCVLGPVWTERTSPPCSCLKTTGADLQIHRTSWWTEDYKDLGELHAKYKRRGRKDFCLIPLRSCQRS